MPATLEMRRMDGDGEVLERKGMNARAVMSGPVKLPATALEEIATTLRMLSAEGSDAL
jgi:hypothetical protein